MTFNIEKNYLIIGDNLEALKKMQDDYANKVKMIYIDPPYNARSTKIYDDNLSHADWLSMMYPRLYLAKSLLREDGVIFISIDDHEQARLKLLCDEIFGEENFVACLNVEMSTTQGMKVSSALKGNIVKNGEYILIYSKIDFIFQNLLYVKKDWDEHYSIYWDNAIQGSTFQFIKDNFQNTPNKFKAKDIAMLYKTNDNFKQFIHDHADKIYQDAQCEINFTFNPEQEALLEKNKYIKYQHGNREYFLKKTKTGKIRQLLPLKLALGNTNDFDKDYCIRKIRGDWWADYYKDMMNIDKEGDIKFPNGKKPVRLIKDIIYISTNKEDKDCIILDFFAGSGTTGQAVMEMNAEDGGNRKFVLVQIDEPCDKNSIAFKDGYKNIAQICEERLRRAGKKIQDLTDVEFEIIK